MLAVYLQTNSKHKQPKSVRQFYRLHVGFLLSKYNVICYIYTVIQIHTKANIVLHTQIVCMRRCLYPPSACLTLTSSSIMTSFPFSMTTKTTPSSGFRLQQSSEIGNKGSVQNTRQTMFKLI